MSYPSNAEYLSGHDFSQDPIKATEAAIRDVITHGAGVIENAFDQARLNREYPRKRQLVPDSRVNYGLHPAEYLDVIHAISEATRSHSPDGRAKKGAITTYGTFVGTVNPNDPWHQDGSLTEPGFRLISQISGPASGLVLVNKNENMRSIDEKRCIPTPEAAFSVAKYAMGTGTVVLLSESRASGLRAAAKDETGQTGVYSLESPFHTGRLESDDVSNDSHRRIVVSHIGLLHGTYIDDLDVTSDKLRGATPLPDFFN